MKFIVAGVGPGDPDLVTTGALRVIRDAGLVLSPHSRAERASVAEAAVRAHIPDLETAPVVFPMTNNARRRDAELKAQLEALRSRDARRSLRALSGSSARAARGRRQDAAKAGP